MGHLFFVWNMPLYQNSITVNSWTNIKASSWTNIKASSWANIKASSWTNIKANAQKEHDKSNAQSFFENLR